MVESSGQNAMQGVKIIALFIAALVSGVAYLGLISRNEFAYELPLEFVELPASPSSEYMVRYKVAFRELLCSNYLLHFATFGACMGLALGAIGAEKNKLSTIATSVIGGAIGGASLAAIAGFLLGWIAFMGTEANWDTTRFLGFHIDPFIQTTLLQCFVWSSVGVGIGLGGTVASCSFARIVKGIQGGLLGGFAAGVVYSVIAAVCFSSSSAVDFVPKSFSERIVWVCVCGLSIFIAFVYAFRTVPNPNSQSDSKKAYPYDAAPAES